MTPIHSDDWLTVWGGDNREVMRTLAAESVQCVVTSPPYWGLRDYGTAAWDGGDPGCEHAFKPDAGATTIRKRRTYQQGHPHRDCKCGAIRIDRQLGLEKSPEEYVATMVDVFREVWRVLRADGTVWLNLGDSYATGGYSKPHTGLAAAATASDGSPRERSGPRAQTGIVERGLPLGLKPKDLVGIPWRVAFALQADGWVLRSEVIWAKSNPMPESVTDRPTKSHEQLFLFSKGKWVGPGEPPVWMPEVDKAWLAALIDGEGTICFQERVSKRATSPTWSVRLSVVNTHRGLLERVAKLCNVGGGPGSPSPRFRREGAPGRPIFHWQVTNAKAASVIAAIRPYLVAKREQADLALAVHLLNQKHAGRSLPVSAKDVEFKRRAAAACSALNHGEEVDLSWLGPVEWGRWTSQPYVYDADAIREGFVGALHAPGNKVDNGRLTSSMGHVEDPDRTWGNPAGRNKRSVWSIATKPYPGAHFATFPEALVEPCILAGTSQAGCCATCGAPWERVVERPAPSLPAAKGPKGKQYGTSDVDRRSSFHVAGWRDAEPDVSTTTGWRRTCDHEGDPVPCVVMDPFAGTGTVGVVAQRLSRRAVLIDLNPDYLVQCLQRNQQTPLGLSA